MGSTGFILARLEQRGDAAGGAGGRANADSAGCRWI
jgi:hypothetical protein